MIITLNTGLSISTSVHEMGHHFGLFHVFEPAVTYQVPANPGIPGSQIDHPYNYDGTPRELVIRNNLQSGSPYDYLEINCGLGGDLCCDTPASCDPGNPNTHPGCAFDVPNCSYSGTYVDYNGMPIDDPTNILAKNFMSYGVNSCREEFTTDQKNRAYGYYEDVRKNQYLTTYCGNLEDKVEYEASDKGLDRVALDILNGFFSFQTLTNADGEFDGILRYPDQSCTSDVKKLGSNPDFTYTKADWRDGVSTYDLVLTHKHVLGIEPLDGYDLVAVDVSNNGLVSTYDIVLIRRMILHIIDEFEDHEQPWRYLPEHFTINFSSDFDGGWDDDPFQYDLDGSHPMFSDKSGFDGVKLGDVNGSNSDALVAGNNEVEGDPVYIDIIKTYLNGEVHVEFKVEDFEDIIGYQLDIDFNEQKLAYLSSQEEDLSGVASYFFGTTEADQGKIYTLWYDELGALPVTLLDQQKIFKLVFNNLDGSTNANISLASNIGFRAGANVHALPNFAIGKDGSIRPILQRHFGAGQLAAIQSIPNPFNKSFGLFIEAVEGGDATVGIFNPVGQQVYHAEVRLDKGSNSLNIGNAAEWAEGFYFVSIEMDGETYTEKIVKTN